MTVCFLCNAEIPLGGGNRRWGGHIGVRASHRRRTICDRCAMERQQAAFTARVLRIGATVVGIGIMLLFIIGAMRE